MKMAHLIVPLLLASGCLDPNQAGTQAGPAPQPASSQTQVEEEIFDAGNHRFEAIEPTVFEIIGAPTIWDALGPVGRLGPKDELSNEQVDVRVRKGQGIYVADIVRSGIENDPMLALHLRIEFRREPEGWFPVNAWRRQKCRNAASPDWTTAPCPG